MWKSLKLIKDNASNPKLWLLVGIGVAGVVVLAHTRRRTANTPKHDFGAFVERFELLPLCPSPHQPLSPLTFAISDIFDVKGYVTGFGNPDWKRAHQVAEITAMVLTCLLMNGATCVGKTVMDDDFSFGITGENKFYGTPGGSSSGSAVAVAAGLVDFALGQFTSFSLLPHVIASYANNNLLIFNLFFTYHCLPFSF